jgi:hypothetical protein
MKSKKKDLDQITFEISLSFTNNIFQTHIFEIFDKLGLNLNPNKLVQDDVEFFNLIKITHNANIFLLMFLDKNLQNLVNNDSLFLIIEKLQKITRTEITFLFYEINEDSYPEKNELIFFLNTEARVKVFDCTNGNDLIDFISNYIDSITSKEEKSKLTFFDNKPVYLTALCELEGITDQQSLTFIKHLMCIPGVSENKAIAIVKIYPSFVSLMNTYMSYGYSDKEKEGILKDIEIPNKEKNKTSRLGQALSSKIYRVFNSGDPNIVIS